MNDNYYIFSCEGGGGGYEPLCAEAPCIWKGLGSHKKFLNSWVSEMDSRPNYELMYISIGGYLRFFLDGEFQGPTQASEGLGPCHGWHSCDHIKGNYWICQYGGSVVAN